MVIMLLAPLDDLLDLDRARALTSLALAILAPSEATAAAYSAGFVLLLCGLLKLHE